MNWFIYEINKIISNFCQDQLVLLPHRFVRTMLDFFSVLELQKIQLQGGKKYSILLSANEIAERNRLKKQNQNKYCEKLLWKNEEMSRSNQLALYVFSDGELIPIPTQMA